MKPAPVIVDEFHEAAPVGMFVEEVVCWPFPFTQFIVSHVTAVATFGTNPSTGVSLAVIVITVALVISVPSSKINARS